MSSGASCRLYLLLVTAVPPFEISSAGGSSSRCAMPVDRGFPAPVSRTAPPRSRVREPCCALLASGALIGVNWFIYVWAIMEGQVYAASIGYYLNPLINVLLGTLFLGERLSRRQWLAVAVAGAGRGAAGGRGDHKPCGISLSLAFSFAFYGLVRKQVSVGSLPGLTIDERNPPAAARQRRGRCGIAGGPQGSSFGQDWFLSLPSSFRAWFCGASCCCSRWLRGRMDYSALGFISIWAPTIRLYSLASRSSANRSEPAKLMSYLC